MTTMKNVTIIPATRELHTRLPKGQTAKRKVAAYARVSTDSEEQLTSYEAQVDYYTRLIQDKPEWQFAGMYTDEGISAVSTRNRDGFNSMVQDALDGKIDLIVTKSVSRFARNTVDSLSTVRKLKEHGTEVYFEKEGIYTFDTKGELLITIMSSLAQEESRSISENVTWGQRKRFADGKVSIAYARFLGYRKGEDGLPDIIPEEAEIVRCIYRLFMDGKTTGAIARHLTQEGIMTPGGKQRWQATTIESILTNEKYKGAALLQKTFTVDFLTKRLKANEGEVPQYYVEHSHPAIIEPEEWDMVQSEMQQRKARGIRASRDSCFSGKLVCGVCGGYYAPKVWHSTSKYRREIWQCGVKYRNTEPCRTPHLYAQDIQQAFLSAFSTLMTDREGLLEDCRLMRETLGDCREIDTRLKELDDEALVVAGMIEKLVDENATQVLDQADYLERYQAYEARFLRLQERREQLSRQRADRMAKDYVISQFMFEIHELGALPLAFDEKLWLAVVDQVNVHEDERLVFTFRNGAQVTERL